MGFFFFFFFPYRLMDCYLLYCDTQLCNLNTGSRQFLKLQLMSILLKLRVHDLQSTYFSSHLQNNTCFSNKLLLPCACPALQTSASRLSVPIPNPERMNRTKPLIHCHPGGSYFCSPAFICFPYVPITRRVLQFKRLFIQHMFYQNTASVEYIQLLLGTCK